MLTEFKIDLNENSDDEMLKVINCLTSYFGQDHILADNMWINCVEGFENRIIPYNKINDELDRYKNEYAKEQGYNFIMGGKSLDNYISISI
ncbi:MAG: hypothetical protein IAE65_01095 [Ignavibacteria bacterium]|nr:hypothetical protein [Ignavibacteria bacterium]